MGNNEKPRRRTWGHIDLPRLLTFCASLFPSHLGRSPESVLHLLLTVMQQSDRHRGTMSAGLGGWASMGLVFQKCCAGVRGPLAAEMPP